MLTVVKIRVVENVSDHVGNPMIDKEYYGVLLNGVCHADIGIDWLWLFTKGQFLVLDEVSKKDTYTNEGHGLVQSLGAKPNKITIDF